MAKFLQLSFKKASGLTQHTEKLKTFISVHNIKGYDNLIEALH
jgi:hypothetical protein